MTGKVVDLGRRMPAMTRNDVVARVRAGLEPRAPLWVRCPPWWVQVSVGVAAIGIAEWIEEHRAWDIRDVLDKICWPLNGLDVAGVEGTGIQFLAGMEEDVEAFDEDDFP